MFSKSSLRAAHLCAFAILASLLADLVLKEHADLQQAMWSCYWGSVAIAIGIFIRSDRLVSSGLIFFVGLGVPAWLAARLVEVKIDPTSFLIHAVPVLAGALYVSKMSAVPRYSALGAWLLHSIPLALAWLLCKPDHNINLAHSVWSPVARFFPLWEFHVLILAVSALTLALAAFCLNQLLRGRHGETAQGRCEPMTHGQLPLWEAPSKRNQISEGSISTPSLLSIPGDLSAELSQEKDPGDLEQGSLAKAGMVRRLVRR